jgi:Uri superfamily endonuclease
MIRKGSYLLIIKIPRVRIEVGALGILDLEEGCYCYVGSAMNGLDQRIGRHLSEKKKMRWHIDYLTKECFSIDAYESAHPGASECMLGNIVQQNGGTPAVKGFGCSDCICHTHLFRLEDDAEDKLISLPFLTKHAKK